MQYKLTGKNILIKHKESVEKSSGGIYIPDGAREQHPIGVVITIGPDVVVVTTGDEVIYDPFAGIRVKLPDGEEYLVVREEEILVIFEKGV